LPIGKHDMENIRYRCEAAGPMTVKEFDRLSEFISENCGIKMPRVKKVLLEARLQKRLRLLGLGSFREYCEYLFNSPQAPGELIHMIDAVTTNKTDFFREPGHFQFLQEVVLPAVTADSDRGMKNKFIVWSAGCSSGEEPYTLAIVLSEFESSNPGIPFSILATDISTRVLEKARLGIYDEHLVDGIPPALKKKYFMRSKNRDRELVRVVPHLRSLIQFQRLNLMNDQFMIPGDLDVIFCRNVIIYFEREKQHQLLSRLCRHLKKDGYLFLGHSETMHGFDLPLIRIASTIYRKVQ
jgi:chemotaxis protein methyltransferase CheR